MGIFTPFLHVFSALEKSGQVLELIFLVIFTWKSFLLPFYTGNMRDFHFWTGYFRCTRSYIPVLTFFRTRVIDIRTELNFRNGNYSTEKSLSTTKQTLHKYLIQCQRGQIRSTRSTYIYSRFLLRKNNDSMTRIQLSDWWMQLIIQQHTLPTLYEKLDVSNEKLWLRFMKSDSYSLENSLPISPFQSVLVVQAFKPGCLYSRLSSFAQQVLGKSTKSSFPSSSR